MSEWQIHDKRMTKQLNYGYELVLPHISKITVPHGFPYTAFRQDGSYDASLPIHIQKTSGCRLSTEGLLHLVESTRPFNFFSQNKNTGEDISLANIYKLLQDEKAFLVLASINIEVNFDALPVQCVTSPLTIISSLQNIKKTSMTIVYDIITSCASKSVAKAHHVIVLLNSKTRKPQSLPDWWLNKYSHLSGDAERKNYRVNSPESHSQNCEIYSYKRTVLNSDTDCFKHTNSISYYRYCMDCVMMKKGKNLKTDLCPSTEPCLKSMEITFRKETGFADELDVVMCEDLEDDKLVDFDIFKVCNARLCFN